MIEEIVTTWRANQNVNLMLIEDISDEGMACTLSTRGGRNVVRQFAHLQYVRVHQLKKRAKPLAEGARVFESKEEPDRATLVEALEDSADRVEEWFRRVERREPGYRTLKRGLVSTLGYLIAHESHHRGSILLTLKQCGHAVNSDLRMGIWDWNKV